MGTFSELYAEALGNFDEPSRSKFSKDSGTLAYRLLNRLYREVCRKTQCTRDSSYFATEANTREYAFPSSTVDGGKIIDFQRVTYRESGWTQGAKLKRLPDFNRIDEAENNVGPPRRYYITNEKIGFSPLPNAAYNIYWWGIVGPSADLTSGETPSLIPADFHHVLSDGLAYWFFRIDKGDTSQGAQVWRAIYEEGLRDLEDYSKGLVSGDLYPGVR